MSRFVSNHTFIRPEDHDEQSLIRRFIDGVPATAPPEASDPVQRILDGVRDDPADTRTLEDWARDLGVDAATLRSRFVASTGRPFPRWRCEARMTRARQLIDAWVRPGKVAEALGYAHATTFSRQFARTHGVSPRAYQWRLIQPDDRGRASTPKARRRRSSDG